jgi:hypothetical protein
MDSKLYIPDKVKIGFQNRDDTFTKKLAYVVYYDMKGELRKEKSWEQWRDKKIDPQDFANTPTEGFVLNKKVGGYKSHWNFRNTHIRVYDPRDFEFEISVPNLLFILTQCDCSRGKGLEGKFVYAWQGTELVLLPERSEEYQSSKTYTALQAVRVKAKDLQPGASYLTKKQECLTYIGKFDHYQIKELGGYRNDRKVGHSKRFIFWDGTHFDCLKEVKNIAATAELQSPPDLAELTQLYYKGPQGSPIKELFTKPVPEKFRIRNGWQDCFSWFYEDPPGVWVECSSHYDIYTSNIHGEPHDPTKISHMRSHYRYELDDGVLIAEYCYQDVYRSPSSNFRNYSTGRNVSKALTYRDPTYLALWARLESGEEYYVNSACLLKG